jgi:chaperonin GroEL (HSP60 family)
MKYHISNSEPLMLQFSSVKPSSNPKTRGIATLFLCGKTQIQTEEQEHKFKSCLARLKVFSRHDAFVAGGGTFELYCAQHLKTLSSAQLNTQVRDALCESLEDFVLLLLQNSGMTFPKALERVIETRPSSLGKPTIKTLLHIQPLVEEEAVVPTFDNLPVKMEVFSKVIDAIEIILNTDAILSWK